MAFCTSCGTQVQAGGKFCVNCGAPLSVLPPAGAPATNLRPQSIGSLPSAVASAQRRILKPDVRVALASTIFVVPQHWLGALEKLLNSVAATPLDIVSLRTKMSAKRQGKLVLNECNARCQLR